MPSVNGDWSDPSTWDCGRAPTNNDTIWVPVGFTITVDINTPQYENMLVIVDGTLFFEGGQKINMCPGGVYVSATGMLDGGNPGSKIDICDSTAWRGPGPTYGPVMYGSVTLPATLTDFDGKVHIFEPGIDWGTGSETNADFFSIGRSTNGMTYVEIGKVKAHGNTNEPSHYSFRDTAAPSGTVYYRLSVVDINGRSEVLKTTAVHVDERTTTVAKDDGCKLSVYPNPCEGQCTVNFSDCPADNSGNITVQVIDANGQLVSEDVPQRNTEGGFTTSIDASNNMAPGVYIVRGVSSKKSYTQNAVIK